jgi:hypothetical protein
LEQTLNPEENRRLMLQLEETRSRCVALEQELSEANARTVEDISYMRRIWYLEEQLRESGVERQNLEVLLASAHFQCENLQSQVASAAQWSQDLEEERDRLEERLAHNQAQCTELEEQLQRSRRHQGWNYQFVNLALGIFFVSLCLYFRFLSLIFVLFEVFSALSSWLLPGASMTMRLFLAFIVSCGVFL